MNYTKKQLGQYIDVLSGFAFKSKDFTNVGIPVIKIKNINPPYVSLEDISCVPISVAYQNPKYILKRGDVLIAMTGSHINQIASVVGRVGRVRYDDLTVLNQRVGKIINKNDEYSNLDYIYYFLSQYDVKVELAQKAGGAANQANISPSDIKNLYFPCPPIEIQNKIATILSRYDSLIENYQKQIKLLEESAQHLYKEWFIDLRFPGHENTKIVDGVPKGWEKKPFGSIIGYEIGGGWGADAKSSNEIIPAYVIRGTDIRDLNIGVWNELPYRFHQESNYRARQLMHNDIVFEVSGGSKNEGVAKTYLVQQELLDKLGNQVICASFCKLIRLKDSSIAYYVFDTLKEWRASGITTQYDKRSASSIVNYRWKDFLSQQEITVPNEIVLRDYIKKSELIHSSIIKISSQIRHLTEARDRLLPKLMSGEIKL